MTRRRRPEVHFLVSQPRSGSTLTQLILANHPEVHTTTEPWIMLAPLLAMQHGGLRGDYQPDLAREAMRGFLDQLPTGERAYYSAVRRYGEHLYAAALAESGKRIFLDKTPRYYLVSDQLRMTFPDAKIIVLSRNPLAVLCSIIETWILPTQAWHRLGRYWQDLLLAPDLLARALRRDPERTYHLRYEDLLDNPAEAVRGLCSFVGIPYRDGMENYSGVSRSQNWVMGDQIGFRHHDEPMRSNRDRWLDSLANPQVWRLAADYLATLEPDTLARLGYDGGQLRQQVDAVRPSAVRRLLSVPLGLFVHRRRGVRLAGFPVAAAMTTVHRSLARVRKDRRVGRR